MTTTTGRDADLIAAAEQVRAEYRRAVEELRGNDTLADRYRSELIAARRDRANAEIADLRRRFDESGRDQREALETQVLAPRPLPLAATTSDYIARDASFRDAMERASKAAEDGEASLAEVHRLATRSRDEIQAHAAFVVAFDRGWVDVVNAYLEDHPELDEAANQLWELTHPANGGAGQLREDLQVELWFAPVLAL